MIGNNIPLIEKALYYRVDLAKNEIKEFEYQGKDSKYNDFMFFSTSDSDIIVTTNLDSILLYDTYKEAVRCLHYELKYRLFTFEEQYKEYLK